MTQKCKEFYQWLIGISVGLQIANLAGHLYYAADGTSITLIPKVCCGLGIIILIIAFAFRGMTS